MKRSWKSSHPPSYSSAGSFTGVLVPKDDAGALAQAAISLLSDPDGLAAMGRRARQRAEQVFGVEANLEAFDRLYRRLAAA